MSITMPVELDYYKENKLFTTSIEEDKYVKVR